MDCLNDAVSLAVEKCPPDPSLDADLLYFTEIIVCEELEIPQQKPDKEEITNVIMNIVVTDIQQITVDLGDGIIRYKVAVTGTIKLGIEYSALVPDQQVHFAHFDIPFQGVIGERPCDPATNRGLIDDPAFDIDDYQVNVCLEHEQYHQLSHRIIKAVLVLLLWLEPTP